MRNKKRYGLLLLVLCLLSCGICYPLRHFLFNGSGNAVWRVFRVGLIGVGAAFLVWAVIVFVREKEILQPFFTKFHTYRPLLHLLVKRDFKAKYKRSVLGVVWTVLNPLLTMLIMTIVFSTLFRFSIQNYPIYLLSGQIFFTLFSESTTAAMGSILGSASMLKKVSVPKYIFPLSKVLSSLVNFLLSLIALFLVMLITRAPFYWEMLLMPIPILYMLIFSLGMGLLLAAAVVFFRDMNYLYGLVILLLSYITPLFYPENIIPAKFHFLLSLNPMYHFVQYFRTVAIYGMMPTLWQNVICLSLALIALAMGLLAFYKKQDRFILYI